MGKKGSWLSAIKKVFSPSTKDKLANGSEKKSSKEKKQRGILKHGETKSFIPLFREPSSIEKILGEADQQKLLVRPPTPSDQQPKTFTQPILPARPTSPPSRITSPRAPSPRLTSPRDPSPSIISPRAPSPRITSPRAPPRIASPRGPSPRVASSRIVRQQTEISYRTEPTLRYHHLSATKIQAVYRGYMARRSFKALRGLVRLQGVLRGQNVKRQTMNAMKHMQLLVKVQTQIQSRRIQMLENQALQRQAYKNDKELESTLGKWTSNQLSEAGDNEYWDDSVITKEEREARLQRKVEALIKRERAMAYAYSHQLWKGTPRSDQTAVMDVRSGGFPWWWNWLERQLPSANPASESQPMKNAHALTPSRQTPTHKPSPRPQTSNSKQSNFGINNLEANTPRSTRSTVPMRTRQMLTPSSRTPPTGGGSSSSSNLMNFLKPRASAANSPFDVPLKDDDSLMSCPPFSVPNYMTPTVSAKAKVRPTSNPKDRVPGTPGNESKMRFSFPFTPNMGSFKWNKGSSKDSTSKRVLEKHHHSPRSIGDFSVDSTLSMPATVGRKPFNRFV